MTITEAGERRGSSPYSLATWSGVAGGSAAVVGSDPAPEASIGTSRELFVYNDRGSVTPFTSLHHPSPLAKGNAVHTTIANVVKA